MTQDAIDFDELLDCAVRAAQAAGKHAFHHADRRREVAEISAHDVKLVLDRECQDIAEQTIQARYPEHAILGEEGRKAQPSSDTLWIIDPIDGTVNFHHGLPYWCSSVAVMVAGAVVVGAVYAPELDALYTASAHTKALLNGKPIAPSAIEELDQALILTGLSKKIETNAQAFPQFERLSRACRKVRVLGAAALDICHVARGAADAYCETSIYLWDVAAAGLIARRAGALTEILTRHSDVHMSYLCTAPRIFGDCRKLCQSVSVLPKPDGQNSGNNATGQPHSQPT